MTVRLYRIIFVTVWIPKKYTVFPTMGQAEPATLYRYHNPNNKYYFASIGSPILSQPLGR